MRGTCVREHGIGVSLAEGCQGQGGEPAQKPVAADRDALRKSLTAEEQAASTERAEAWFREHPLAMRFVSKAGDADRNFPLLAVAEAETAAP